MTRYSVLLQSKICFLLGLATIGLLFCSSTANAQHLWDRRHASRVSLYNDTQAVRPGDLVTVIIQQSTDVSNQDQRAMQRSSQAGGGMDLSTAFGGDLGRLAGTHNFDSTMQNNNRFDGTSSYNVARGFTDRLTVRVAKVLPNGNLVIHGARRQRIAGEFRTLTISGVIRPFDIRADNTIQSQFVGDLRLCYAGDGDESAFSNQGWLAKRINRFLPF